LIIGFYAKRCNWYKEMQRKMKKKGFSFEVVAQRPKATENLQNGSAVIAPSDQQPGPARPATTCSLSDQKEGRLEIHVSANPQLK
jgi:hypothetical protein